jgi:hypothetical protein
MLCRSRGSERKILLQLVWNTDSVVALGSLNRMVASGFLIKNRGEFLRRVGTSPVLHPDQTCTFVLHPSNKMFSKPFCAFAALLSTTFAVPALEESADSNVSFKSIVQEKLAGPPAGWVEDKNMDFDKSSMINLRIHLVHQDMDKFHELALNVRKLLMEIPYLTKSDCNTRS